VDNDRNDGSDNFDDLFEPFNLEGGPPRGQQPDPGAADRPSREQAAVPGPGYALPCPSCGSLNPPDNRHCESCGARMGQGRLPVAPQPMLRTTAGARALMVLAGVILVVAVLALVVNVFRGGSNAAVETSTTTTTSVPVEIEQLIPVSTRCSSQLAAFPCTALTDNDPDNRWNATEGGIGADLTFLFSPPVQITELFIDNVQNEERFRRNARAKGLEITTDDIVQSIIVELDDTNAPQKVQIGSIRTSSLTITITSAYPGQTFEGKEPFTELAMQQITFYGRISPDAGG
jgi:hypothetical protein